MYRFLEEELLKWKKSRTRYPLLLRGARQVGKTYIVEKFGKSAFSSFVSVNFEAQPELVACFESLDPEEILLRLQVMLKRAIRPGETLLFLDEIQMCPQAILALRYFKEKLPALHVIGAGSLLEFTLAEGRFSFPVGRIQFLYLKPLSFEEFALARGKKRILDQLAVCTLKSPPSETLHREFLQLVREYFYVGGMPAAVSNYCEHYDFREVSLIHEILLSTYQTDFGKYATPTEQKYLKVLFAGIFSTIAQQFKFAKIDSQLRSRELKQALDHLKWAGLVELVHASSANGIPLSATLKQHRFKLLFFDIGLVQRALKIDPESILDKELIQVNRGALAEQFVGQELLAHTEPHEAGTLCFWQREKKGSDAEIDFLCTSGHTIYPIEVKAGPYGKLKSLNEFIKEKQTPFGIRISEKPLSFERGVLSIPFYMIRHLNRFISQLAQTP